MENRSPREKVSAPVQHLLWAHSGAVCAAPRCERRLLRPSAGGRVVTVGEVAHIHGVAPNAARYLPGLADVNAFENLLLLCLEHHALIDGGDTRDEYPPDLLRSWKHSHESKYDGRHLASLVAAGTLTAPQAAIPLVKRAEYDGLRSQFETSTRIALVGLSGCGKTQAAVDYFENDGSTWKWWLRGGDRSSLVSGLAAIETMLSGTGSDGVTDEATLADAARRRLLHLENWLLIVDGLDDVELLRSLPATGGRILITSTMPIERGYKDLTLGSFTRDQSILVLQTADSFANGSLHDRQALADSVSDHPLAIAQLLAFSIETGMPLATHLSLVSSGLRASLQRGVASGEVGVASTLEMASSRLSDQALSLLRTLSLLKPAPMPLGQPMEQAGASWLGTPMAREMAIGELRRFSLVRRSGDVVEVHPLVARLTHEAMGAVATRQHCRLATAWLGEQLPVWAERADNRAAMASLEPHIQTVAHRWNDLMPLEEGEALALSHLLGRLATHYSVVGRGAEAETCWAHVLSLLVPFDSPDVAEGRASVAHNQALYVFGSGGDSARERGLGLMRQAIDMKRVAYGRDHELTGLAMGALGDMLSALGDTTEAMECYREAKAIYYMAGASGDFLAEIMGDMASMMITVDPDGALDMAQSAFDALDIGSDRWDVAARVLRVLSECHSQAGELDRALQAAKQAVERCEQYADATFELAEAYFQWGTVFEKSGQRLAAAEKYRKSLLVAEEYTEGTGQSLALKQGNVGLALCRLGMAQEGVELLRRHEKSLTDRPEVASSVLIHGRLMLLEGIVRSGDLTKARTYAAQLVESHGEKVRTSIENRLGPQLLT